MKKNILVVVFIIIGMIVILNFNDYNLKRTVSACIVAQKQTSESFDPKKSKKFCEEEIKKKKN